ncbi:hypothetical protein BDZ97DRAFT_1762834 [Flammula alnicola]|nr:hypothetical protein BDZ97DRAFT_1762834 [Flammula alnicola]
MTPESSGSGNVADIDCDAKERPVNSLEANFHGTFEENLKETERLKARLYQAECENTRLKLKLKRTESELKDTQALLGKAVVSASRKEKELDSPPISGPSLPDNLLKRARSPSLELIEMPVPAPKKSKGKEKEKEAPTQAGGTTTPGRNHNMAYVDIPLRSTNRNTSLRTENLSRPKVDQVADDLASRLKLDTTHKRIPAEEDLPNDASQGRVETGMASLSSSSSCIPGVSVPAPQTSLNLQEVNPRRNIKSQHVFSLPQSVADMYLQGAKALEISPPPLDLEVPRKFLRLAYGGSDQHFLQFIQAGKNPSRTGLRRLVWPMLDLNPSMPSSPGEPGLVFASRHEILSNPPWTVFCKRSNAKALWLYLGEYENVLGGKMTAEQFRSQSKIVQREWANLLLTRKKYDVYVSMRARIALRIASIIPIADKEEEEKLIQAEVQAVKDGKGRPVTEGDIISAFSKGDEAVDIIRMICIKYDHVFADDIKAKFSNYDAMLAAEKKKKPEKSNTTKGKAKKTGGAKLKHRAPSVSNDSDSEDSAESLSEAPPIGQHRSQRASRQMIESMGSDAGEDIATTSEDAFSDLEYMDD